jgi:uncharacterized Zn finger protein (UPF0148 family)
VRCTNILRYDPQQGKYLRCNHEFKLADELAGKSVKCPQCGQTVEVAVAQVAPPEEPPPVRIEPIAKTSAPQNRGPSREDRPQAWEASPDYPEVLDEDDEFRLLAPVELPPRESIAPPPPAPPEAPKSTSSSIPGMREEVLPGDQKASCPGCGKPLMTRTVICPSCGYHKGLNRRVDDFQESGDDDDKPTGFERWLRKQLADGDDPGAIRSVLIIAGLILVGLGAMLFLTIGHLVWILVGAAGVVAAGAWLGWWKLDPWQWLMFANRMIGWRQPMPPFPHRKVLDLRNMAIGDEELAALKNLSEFDVIDLEGAPVTDHGLPALYDYRNFQFIVLKDTQVTEDGAKRLQQALPSAWIWR